MPTWALVLIAGGFLVAVLAIAFVYTATHKPEQEDPWRPNDSTP